VSTPRVLHLAVDLLDYQIVDRDGVACGNVDDVELTIGADGSASATALLTGPGVLLYRFGGRRLGRWLQRMSQAAGPHPDRDRDTSRVPVELIEEVGPAIKVDVRAEELASMNTERWVRDHVIGRIPGARHAPE